MGQALRLCYVEGIHRELPEEIFGIEASRRCRALWWAFYVFDRRLTALVGAPSSIRDEDITVILPSELNTSADAATLAISINLSRLLATITTSQCSAPPVYMTLMAKVDLCRGLWSRRKHRSLIHPEHERCYLEARGGCAHGQQCDGLK